MKAVDGSHRDKPTVQERLDAGKNLRPPGPERATPPATAARMHLPAARWFAAPGAGPRRGAPERSHVIRNLISAAAPY